MISFYVPNDAALQWHMFAEQKFEDLHVIVALESQISAEAMSQEDSSMVIDCRLVSH
jgi:hypothetical protein